MNTYNFIYKTIDGEEKQVEINAESEQEAWKSFYKLSTEFFIYVDII